MAVGKVIVVGSLSAFTQRLWHCLCRVETGRGIVGYDLQWFIALRAILARSGAMLVVWCIVGSVAMGIGRLGDWELRWEGQGLTSKAICGDSYTIV